MNTKVIAISNQKGGVGKTTTTVSLGVGFAQKGKRVLLIDTDPQGSLSIALGYKRPDDFQYSLAEVFQDVLLDRTPRPEEAILHTDEAVDLLPANIMLSGLELQLTAATCRESILKKLIQPLKSEYDYIIIDCMPSLGLLTINALVAADSVLIPTLPHYLSSKGLEQLIKTIFRLRELNPDLKIEGILFTMVNVLSKFQKETIELTRESYGEHIRIFKTEIPNSVKAVETAAEGKSIYEYDEKGKVSNAYKSLIDEVTV